MKVKVNTTIGKTNYEFEFEGSKEMDELHKAAVLGNPPRRCNLCGNYETFKLDSNKDKEANIYVNVVCKCGAKAKLGQYKAGGYFWHKFELFNKESAQTSKQEDTEDIPF